LALVEDWLSLADGFRDITQFLQEYFGVVP